MVLWFGTRPQPGISPLRSDSNLIPQEGRRAVNGWDNQIKENKGLFQTSE